MKYKLKNTLPRIQQQRCDWCIPACIEISLKYLQPIIDVSQKEFWDLLNGKQPSFGVYKEILSKLSKFNSFTFEHWGPGDINDLKEKIENAIKNNYPTLLSMPVIFPARGWHIRVCHTITNRDITMYNPGNNLDETELFDDIEAKTKNRNGGDILIVRLA